MVEVLSLKNVQEYSRHTKELSSSQSSKALKFLTYGCIRYVGDLNSPEFDKIRLLYDNAKHIFLCLPLNKRKVHSAFNTDFSKVPFKSDYNFSEYIMFKNKNNTFECNCQGWQSKKRKGKIIEEGANCSHVLALLYSFKLKKFVKKKQLKLSSFCSRC